MKLTDSEIIKNGERDLLDSITADLDWGAIEDIFMKEHNLAIDEDIEYRSGDIIALEDQIAYKLEFEVKVNLSIILDRAGNYISIKAAGKENQNTTSKIDETPLIYGDDVPEGEVSELESRVDDVLNKITTPDDSNR
jgi:hypothetical protein